jgi:oligopeptidase B
MLQCTRNKSAKKAVVAAAAASIVGGFLAKQIKRRFFSNHVAPTPTKEDFEYTVAGRALADEYNWMRDETRKSPRVLGHINRENRYCASTLDFKAADHSVVYKEMIGHIKEDNTNFPYRRTKYFYYTQDIKGKDYQVYMRVPVAADEPEQLYLDETQELDRQVLLDVNKLAAGFEYFNLGGLAISPCEEFLCYAFETDGSETYKLRTIEIATGRVVESIDVDSLTDDMCFGADSRTLFYVTMDEAHRPYRAFRHVVGGDCTHDELLVEEPDELYCLDVYKTQSSKFLVLRSAGPTESANWVMDLVASADGKSECKPHVRLVQERQEGVRYFLDHTRGQFYIYTNADDCVNFKLVRAPEAHPGKENWVEVIAHTQDVTITDVECFLNHLVVSFRQDGFTQVRVLTFANRLDSVDDATFATDCQLTSDFADLNFADPMYTVYPALNRRFACDYVRVLYTSMTRPTETIDVSVADVSDMKTLHCKEVPNYDKSLYNSERVWATSSVDNKTRIPCSAVFRGAERKPDSPMFLVGYGAYGYSYEPEFSSTILPLLDRGVVVVYAHIRGGAEMGEVCSV